MRTRILLMGAAFTAGLNLLHGQNIPDGAVFQYDFSQESRLDLQKNAKIADGVLALSGKGDFAYVPESENMHFAGKGMTLAVTVRLDYSETDPSANNRMDMFFSKGREFIFGRSNSCLYFNFHNGQQWCAALTTREGAVPKPGEWAHVAVTVGYESDPAQGDFGYRISIYLNGEREVSRRVSLEAPVQTQDQIELGKGFGGGPWFMNGAFANAVIFDRPLSSAEIERLCRQEPRVKTVRKGFVAIEPALQEQADRIQASGNAEAKWLADSFLRAAASGYDQQTLISLADLTERNQSDDLETLTKKLEQAQSVCRILLTSDLAAAVLTGEGTGTHPVIGVLDRRTGKEIFGERTLCWEIQWKRDGEKGELPSQSPDVVWKSEFSGNTISIVWKGNSSMPFTARSEVRVTGPRMESTFELRNESDFTFESVKYPVCLFRHLGKGDTLVYPRMSGVLVPNPIEEPVVRPSPYPSGSDVMQFTAYYNEAREGIYFGYEDGLARTKTLHTDGKRNDLIVGWENPMIADKGKNHFELNGKAVIELYHGQWYEAGRIYRRFLEKDAAWWIAELPRKTTPEWFRNNTLWILYYDKTKKKEDIPSTRNIYAYLRSYFELPFVLHWYGWDDKKLGWPHFPARELTLPLNEELRKSGIRTIPYIDTRLWKVLDGPEKTDFMYQSHGHKYAAKQPNGKIYEEDYGNGNVYAVMCPNVPDWQNVISDLVKRISGSGFSGIYHDQVGTGAPKACYDSAHGHLLNDSSLWLEKGYWPMFAQFLGCLRENNPQFCHVTEENAEPYLKQMDGYLVWRWLDEHQIPLYQSIYAGRAQFVGRTFNSMRRGDPQSFFSKVGQQLVNAEQIGWFTVSEVSEADDRRLFVKKAMHLRTALLNWFNEGRMLAPIDFGGTMKMERPVWSGVDPHRVTMPVIASSAWEDKDGTRIWLFVNTQQEDSSAVPVIESDRGFWICREGADLPVFSHTSGTVSLKPLQSEVWVEGDREKAEVMQKTLRRIASFDKGKSIQMILRLNQKEISGTPDRLYTAKDRSYHVECNAAADDSYIGWIQHGAIISFGVVDFGQDGARTITVSAAVSPDYEGGTIQLLTTAPGQPETESAVFPLQSTGGWSTFKEMTVPLKEPLTGKHQIVFRINGNAACNFKGWKYSR